MFKKTLIACLLVATMTASVPNVSFAFGFPNTDFAKIAREIMDNIMTMAEAAIEQAMEEAELEQMEQNTEDYIDAFNNGAANMITRINQARTDIFNLGQLEKAMPAQGSCANIYVSGSLDDALCGENSTIRKISNLREAFTKINSIVSASYTSNQSPQGIGNMSLAASGDGATLSAASKALKLYREELDKHVVNLEEHELAGRKEYVTMPELTIPFDGAPLEFTDEQLDIAMSRMFIEHPPYIHSLRDPQNEQEEIAIKRRILFNEIPSQVIAKDIAMKTKPSPEMPSRLMAMDLAGRIRLTPEATFDGETKSFLQDIASGGSGSGAETREETLMYSIKLYTELERYKQLLDMEYQIANYGLIKDYKRTSKH